MTAGWHPVSLSAGLASGTSNGTHLFGREIVIWRDDAGLVHAWEDRCPHRGMRLSLGFVRGDRIACLYHGWQYDSGARCRFIPAHPALTPPDTIRLPTFRSAEAGGMVWVALGEAGGLPAVPDATLPVRSMMIEAPMGQVIAAMAEAPVSGRAWSMQMPSLFADDDVLAGVQAVSESETAVHIALTGEDDRRRAVNGWAEALRGRAETGLAA